MSASSRGYEYAKRLLHRFTRQHAVLRHHKHSPFCEPLENRMLLSTSSVELQNVNDGASLSECDLFTVVVINDDLDLANPENALFFVENPLNLNSIPVYVTHLTLDEDTLSVEFQTGITVTGTGDSVDGDTSSLEALALNPGDDGAITLREAVQAANNTEGEDVIEFDQTLAGQTITLSSELNVLDSLTINGLGQDQLTLSAEGIFAFFNVDMTNTPDGTFTLSDITLQGHADFAVYANPGNVTLDNVTLQGDGDITDDFKINSTGLEFNSKITVKNAGLVIQTSGNVFIDDLELDGSLSITSVVGDIYLSGNLISNGGSIAISANVVSFDGPAPVTDTDNNASGGSVTLDGGNGGGGYIPGETVSVGGDSNSGGVTVSDGSDSSNPGSSGTIDVIDENGNAPTPSPNTAPIAHDITGTATENGDAITLAFDATDSNSGDTLTYQFLSQPGNGFVTNLGNGQFRYTPGDWQQLIDGQSRELSFTYRAIDNHGTASEPATVTITLLGQTDIADGPNAAPVAIPKLVKTDSRTLAMIDVTGNVVDPDGDVVFVWAPDGVSDLGVPLQTGFSGEVFYDPTGYFDGYEVGQRVRDCFTVEVYDAYGNADRTKVFVDVIIAAAPVATLASNGPVVLHSQAPKQVCDMAWAPAAELAMVSATVQPVSTTAPGWLQSLLQSGNDDQHVDRLRLMLVEG